MSQRQRQPDTVLEMLVGNEWRYLETTRKRALRLLSRTAHRGYLLYPLPDPKAEKTKPR